MSDPDCAGLMSLIRLPWAPLESLMNEDKHLRGQGGSMSIRTMGKLSGISFAKLHQYARDGVPTFRADQIAAKCFGVHPSHIWLEEWFDSAELEPICRWCADPAPARSAYCSEDHKKLWTNERKTDSNRRRGWWARLDRYRNDLEEAM